ncbi:hypothetical protein [Rheinheimera hassiensis]|uniref:hypothetical protein n=1 Tax=Rheinheimera hassiensis TaxID=1193627 RepID=UPI001F051FE7|nr:hypothetical protein [Rheinheimera hassiensis]
MNNEDLFSVAIELYDSLKECINLGGGFISLTESINLTNRQAGLLRNILENKEKFRTIRLIVDHDLVEDPTVISEGKLCSEFKIELSPFEYCCFSFYRNELEMLKRLSPYLLQGRSLPSLYYLTEKKYRSDSNLALPAILNLQVITRWISFLKEISDIHKVTESGICLYFLIKSGNDKFSKPLEINISNIECLCSLENISSVDDIAMLISEAEQGNLHSKDKQAFFKLALVDVLRAHGGEDVNKRDSDILFKNLDKVKSAYYEHYEVFIHNFAIGEFQQQVQEKWFDYSEKISGVLSDIKTKLYAVPIVLVSLGTLSALPDVFSYYFIVIGVLVTAVINFWMVKEQSERLEQIAASSTFIFEKLRRKGVERSEPVEIFTELNEVIGKVSSRISAGRKKIIVYKYLCWLPTLVMLALFALKEGQQYLHLLTINVKPVHAALFEFFVTLSKSILSYFL